MSKQMPCHSFPWNGQVALTEASYILAPCPKICHWTASTSRLCVSWIKQESIASPQRKRQNESRKHTTVMTPSVSKCFQVITPSAVDCCARSTSVLLMLARPHCPGSWQSRPESPRRDVWSTFSVKIGPSTCGQTATHWIENGLRTAPGAPAFNAVHKCYKWALNADASRLQSSIK